VTHPIWPLRIKFTARESTLIELVKAGIRWCLTATAVGRVEVDSDVLPDEVKGGTANGDVEEVGGLFVEGARIGEGSHE
jgi:hypothetical protein